MASLPTTHGVQRQVPLARLSQRAFMWILATFTPYKKLDAATSDGDLSLVIVKVRSEWKNNGFLVRLSTFGLSQADDH
jgi:hypothetical protein